MYLKKVHYVFFKIECGICLKGTVVVFSNVIKNIFIKQIICEFIL